MARRMILRAPLCEGWGIPVSMVLCAALRLTPAKDGTLDSVREAIMGDLAVHEAGAMTHVRTGRSTICMCISRAFVSARYSSAQHSNDEIQSCETIDSRIERRGKKTHLHT
jgi:hypothetical protein